MTTISKYFMFGKYSCLDTNARGCCMHVFLVGLIIACVVTIFNFPFTFNGNFPSTLMPCNRRIDRIKEATIASSILETAGNSFQCLKTSLIYNREALGGRGGGGGTNDIAQGRKDRKSEMKEAFSFTLISEFSVLTQTDMNIFCDWQTLTLISFI